MTSRLRKLHEAGREYTWTATIRAAPGPDGFRKRCIRVRGWGSGKNSCALQVDLVERIQPAERSYPYPTADDVRAMIGRALNGGWTPDALGGTYRLTPTTDLVLPRFAVTDVLFADELHHLTEPAAATE